MKIIMIGGEPATGKSTLMKLIKKGIETEEFSVKTAKGECTPDHELFILGIYDGGDHDGTDRLSMSVQPHAEKYIEKIYKKYPNSTILCEGDRLFNKKFLNYLEDYNYGVIILDVPTKTVDERHVSRGDSQSEVFIKGRRTKVRNIAKGFEVIIKPNVTKKDLKNNAKYIHSLIKMKDKKFVKHLEENVTSMKEKRQFITDDKAKHGFW